MGRGHRHVPPDRRPLAKAQAASLHLPVHLRGDDVQDRPAGSMAQAGGHTPDRTRGDGRGPCERPQGGLHLLAEGPRPEAAGHPARLHHPIRQGPEDRLQGRRQEGEPHRQPARDGKGAGRGGGRELQGRQPHELHLQGIRHTLYRQGTIQL